VIVLDASVIIKWVLDDELQSQAALAYRDQHFEGTHRVAVPELLFYEMANVLATKTALSQEEAIEAFTLIVESELESYSLGSDEFSEAIRLSKRFKISLYDSSYIALAEALGCEMITADAQLASKVKGVRRVKRLS
jgi:predicted nucleic acid-binding protein